MWEYKRVNVEFLKTIEINEYLNKLGSDNWEIIHYNEDKPDKFGSFYKITLILKRKIL